MTVDGSQSTSFVFVTIWLKISTRHCHFLMRYSVKSIQLRIFNQKYCNKDLCLSHVQPAAQSKVRVPERFALSSVFYKFVPQVSVRTLQVKLSVNRQVHYLLPSTVMASSERTYTVFYELPGIYLISSDECADIMIMIPRKSSFASYTFYKLEGYARRHRKHVRDKTREKRGISTSARPQNVIARRPLSAGGETNALGFDFFPSRKGRNCQMQPNEDERSKARAIAKLLLIGLEEKFILRAKLCVSLIYFSYRSSASQIPN